MNTNTTTADTSTSTADQTDQQDNNNNNNLGKQGFANYKHMNHCLSDQVSNHGLDQNAAVSACSKMLQDHLKAQSKQKSQQQQSNQINFIIND
jgi:hypothetical protein